LPAADSPPPTRVTRLRRRAEFVAVAATGRRFVTPAFVLQLGRRPDATPGEIGLGFTASRRIGKAVERNRARRRLREAARLLLPGPARPGYNYVIVARPAVLTWPFARLSSELRTAFARLAPGREALRAAAADSSPS
jgi:ribonuclease P protein component